MKAYYFIISFSGCLFELCYSFKNYLFNLVFALQNNAFDIYAEKPGHICCHNVYTMTITYEPSGVDAEILLIKIWIIIALIILTNFTSIEINVEIQQTYGSQIVHI